LSFLCGLFLLGSLIQLKCLFFRFLQFLNLQQLLISAITFNSKVIRSEVYIKFRVIARRKSLNYRFYATEYTFHNPILKTKTRALQVSILFHKFCLAVERLLCFLLELKSRFVVP
jgi:hypothetical protein